MQNPIDEVIPEPTPAPKPNADRRAALATLWQMTTLALGGSAAAGLAACGGGSSTPAPPPPAPAPGPTPPPISAPPPVTANTFTSGLQNPWGMAFLPDGRILVTQKAGALVIVTANGRTVGAPVTGVPVVDSAGQGGLLDVALDPDFATDPWVYMTFSEPGSGAEAGKAGTAVARGQLVGNALQNVSVIFRQSPKVSGTGHYGSRLAFRTDKTLFVTLGERQTDDPANPTTDNAQNLTKHLGKVVRINRDGTIPGDNPNLGAGAAAGIWSYGHRNPQGAAIHPTTGELWQSEHGPQGGDEINISRAGRNYGWPLRSYGCPYGSPVNGDDNSACRTGGGTHAPTFEEPLTYWVPYSIAPSGLAFYTGTLIPEWQGNLFTGALAGMALWRLVLSGNTVVSREELFKSLNERIRDVRQGPDGALYLLTDNSAGRIIRVAR